jgi:flagellar assembly protein FliH
MSTRVLAQTVQPLTWKRLHEEQAPLSAIDPEEQIRLLRQEWVLEAQNLTQKSYEEGFAAATTEWNQEKALLSQRFEQATNALAGYKSTLREQAETDVVELALAIAGRILQSTVHQNRDVLQQLVNTVLKRVGQADSVRLRASNEIGEQLGSVTLPPSVQVTIDPTLAEGALLVETPEFHLDASIASQLEEVERGFRDRLGWRPRQ